MAARTHDGRPFGALTIFDGHPRGRLAIKVARSIRSHYVIECLADLFVIKGVPEHIRSDDCGERVCGVERGLFVVA